MKTLREFMVWIDNKATVIFHTTGVVYPMWHCVKASGEHAIVMSPHDDKDTSALLMRAYFELHDVIRYVFIDEAYSLYLANDDPQLQTIMQTGLKDHPGRIECLMYQGEDADGLALGAHRVITRPPHGKPKLGPLEFVEAVASEGRLVGMLPQRGAMQ